MKGIGHVTTRVKGLNDGRSRTGGLIDDDRHSRLLRHLIVTLTTLVALVWLNLRVRWREWRTSKGDGVFLQQMRAVWAADVIRPRRYRTLRLVRLNPKRGQGGVRHVA